jgi:hypothetical protein
MNQNVIRKCKLCGVTSLETRFYDGVTNRCAECHKECCRNNRAEKLDYYQKYDAKRYRQNAKRREKLREYDKSPRGKLVMAKARKKWLALNQEKRAAHVLIGSALRDGRITKPKNCTICNKGGVRIHGHHSDYTKPFSVIWCCKDCHAAFHTKHHFAEAA